MNRAVFVAIHAVAVQNMAEVPPVLARVWAGLALLQVLVGTLHAVAYCIKPISPCCIRLILPSALGQILRIEPNLSYCNMPISPYCLGIFLHAAVDRYLCTALGQFCRTALGGFLRAALG